MPTVTSAPPRSQVVLIPKRHVEAQIGVAPPDLIEETDTWFAMTEANFAVITRNYEDDSAKINGYVRATRHYITTREGTATMKSWYSPEFFQTLLAVMLQEVTSGSASSNVAEVQTITLTTVTTGSFAPKFRGAATPAQAFNVPTATLQAALEAVPTIGTGNVLVTGTAGTSYVLTFSGALANMPLPLIEILEYGTDGTIVPTRTTPGSAAGVYLHTTKFPSKCDLSALTIPIIELLGCPGLEDTQKLYRGAAPNTLGIDLKGQGPIEMTGEFVLAGYEDSVPTLPFAVPTVPEAVHDCFGNMVTVYFGPVGNEPIPSDALRALSISMNANIERPDIITRQVEAADLQFGEASPTLEISLTIKGSKADEYYEWFSASEFDARYVLVVVIDPQTGAQAKSTLTCHKVAVTAVEMSAEGNETRLAMTLMPEDNATDDGPGVWTIETPTASYNQTV